MDHYDKDLDDRLRSGGALVVAGVTVLVVTFLGTCATSMTSSGDPAASLEAGQSTFSMLGLLAGIALVVFGQVRKSNARNEAERRYLEENTRVDVVLDEEADGGPFRGAMKEVEVLDPVVAGVQAAERERDHRRGTNYLIIGGTIMLLVIGGMFWVVIGGDYASPRQAVDRILTVLGMSLFPFGLGLYLAIKGALLRSK